MREAQILGLNFQEMERREQIAKQKFREVIDEYLETIYKLHGRFLTFKLLSRALSDRALSICLRDYQRR